MSTNIKVSLMIKSTQQGFIKFQITLNIIPSHSAMMNTKQTQIKLGKCLLLNQTSSTWINHISPSLRGVLASDEWKLGDREFRDLTAIQIFLNSSIIQAVTIWLDFNKKASIIEDIQRPKYTHLKVIYLGDNNITTIEPLQHLDAPQLEKLFLNHNKIATVKSLRKCIFPKLLELNLNGNVINDEYWLTQTNFPLLDKVSLGYKKNNHKIDEYSWFLKAQIRNQTQIISPKHKLHTFNRLNYFHTIKEGVLRRIQPKDLFKTFEN